jgi:metal-responsive CopG/Arc/MetJ family transcriptional regulator
MSRHEYCLRRGMNTTISIPDGHLAAIDRLAKQLGITRNEAFRKAIELFLEHGHPEVETVGYGTGRRKEPKW